MELCPEKSPLVRREESPTGAGIFSASLSCKPHATLKERLSPLGDLKAWAGEAGAFVQGSLELHPEAEPPSFWGTVGRNKILGDLKVMTRGRTAVSRTHVVGTSAPS